MSLSMYELTIPMLTKYLDNLSAILDKAIIYSEGKKIDPSVLVNARLAPDMFPLSRQIQIACDIAKGCAARLAKIEVPVYADDESTLIELKARISKTLQFIRTVSASQVNGSEDSQISLKVGAQELNFDGKTYLSQFVLPNFYFHVTTTYAILRHNGLDIGKKDYLG